MLIFDILCLIGVKGTKTPPKMLKHFSRAWADSRMLFSVLREQRDRRDPADTIRSSKAKNATSCGNAFVTNIVLA